MSVTLFGIITLIRLVHPENASPSIFVTLPGIVMLFKLVHP